MPDFKVCTTVVFVLEADSQEEATEYGKLLEDHMEIPEMPSASHIDWWPHYIESTSSVVFPMNQSRESGT